MTTTEHPFPTDTLTKGSRVTIDVIEQAYNVVRDTTLYRLAALKAAQYIQRKFEERGLIVVVVSRFDGLHVLTDAEASVNRERRIKSSFGAAKRSLFQMGAVDRSKLTPERVVQHDRSFEVLGRAMSAASRERRISAPASSVRQTPVLVDVSTKKDGK